MMSGLGDYADYFRTYGFYILMAMILILSYVVITYFINK